MSAPIPRPDADAALPLAGIEIPINSVRMAGRAMCLANVGTLQSERGASGVFAGGDRVKVLRIDTKRSSAEMVYRFSNEQRAAVELEGLTVRPHRAPPFRAFNVKHPVTVDIDCSSPKPTTGCRAVDLIFEACDRILRFRAVHAGHYTTTYAECFLLESRR